MFVSLDVNLNFPVFPTTMEVTLAKFKELVRLHYLFKLSMITLIFQHHAVCSSNEDCSTGYFCGNPLPEPNKNFFDNPGAVIPGDIIFLQRDPMGFDGSSVVSLPSNTPPPLMTDLTIFATVCQADNNDGYVVGKGINDRIRDFGLYLRSSLRRVWIAYGSDGSSPGFRSFIYFYNVSLADGQCHSIAAVIDSASNRAVLYVDGEAIRIHAPLPSLPDFRPNVSSHFMHVYTQYY